MVVAVALGAMLLLAGCPTGVHVRDLNNNPGKYFGKEVGVEGTVVNSFGALGQGAYEVDDGTGRIWIVSEGYGVPAKGARVKVAGNFMQGASFGGRSFGLALRQTHRTR
jgi:hypothetical protein